MPIQKLHRQNAALNKVIFERQTELDIINTTIVSGLNAYFVGDPGGGKSYLTDLKMMFFRDAKKFFRNFTAFTKPEEVTGGYDLIELKNGKLKLNADNYLPCANAFTGDEIGRGQTVKGILLPLINEGIFVQDGIVMNRPFKITDVFLSNTEFTNPDDEALDDRMHLRHFVERINEKASWDALDDLDGNTLVVDPNDCMTIAEVQTLRNQCLSMKVPQDVKDAKYEIMKRLEMEEKIFISPRTYRAGGTATKAMAMLNGKSTPTIEDLSILTHVFALKKLNYQKVKKIVNAVCNAELERLTVLLDNAEALHEEWFSKGNEGDHRSYANKLKMIVSDFMRTTPSPNNAKFYGESLIRMKKLHADMLEKATKQLQKLAI